MTTRNSNELPQIDIPPEKAEVIARVREMEPGGWEGLRSLSDAELAELEVEVNHSYVYQPGKHGSAGLNVPLHPHNQTRQDCLSAIIKERKRREDERVRHHQGQLDRENTINEVCGQIAVILNKLDRITGIEPDPSYPFVKVPSAPVLDVPAASDGELAAALKECRFILDSRFDPKRRVEQAEAIAAMKGKTAASLASELQARAEATAKRRDAAAALVAEIEEEQRRREEERRGLEMRTTREGIDERLRMLESLVANETATD